jgi:hypothetical protein
MRGGHASTHDEVTFFLEFPASGLESLVSRAYCSLRREFSRPIENHFVSISAQFST